MGKFKRQHYRAVAGVLHDLREDAGPRRTAAVRELDEVTETLAELFESDSPKFRRDLFVDAAANGGDREP